MITICIPTYRRPHLLKNAIQSALDQTYKDLKIVISDNASCDDTKEVVASFAAKDRRIHPIHHAENLGMLGNYNYLLSIVDTPFFSFLSDDDIVLPHFCETAMEGFQRYPDIAFFAASTIIRNPSEGIIRIPLHEWPREGKFLPEEGACEMIGKYPVPLTVLFRKQAQIDLNNPVGWDCDFLLQLAVSFPCAISKKVCGIFFNHDTSFTGSIGYEPFLQSIEQLVVKLPSLPWRSIHCKRRAEENLQKDWIDCFRGHIISHLLLKHFAQAKIGCTQLLKKDRAPFSLFLTLCTWIFSLCPPLIFFLIHYRKYRLKQRQRKFQRQGYS